MKVVFDTNIVASATFWRGKPFDCMVACAEGKCEAVVSPAILAEYHETIEELRADYSDRTPVEWADALAESALLVFPADRVRGVTSDPDDEMFLECALAGEVDYIVTGDKKHLLPVKEFEGVKIVDAAEFLQLVTKRS